MGRKRSRDEEAAPQQEKKTKLLDDESDEEEGFQINQDFAEQFEYQHKRKELQQRATELEPVEKHRAARFFKSVIRGSRNKDIILDMTKELDTAIAAFEARRELLHCECNTLTTCRSAPTSQ